MVCLVGNGDELPHSGELVKRLREDLPCLESVVFNSNRGKTNVILGKRCQALWGKDGIVDHLCGLSFFLSPLSFYQVNRDQAEIQMCIRDRPQRTAQPMKQSWSVPIRKPT